MVVGQAYQRGRHVGLPSVLARHRRHEVVSTIHSRVSAAMTVKHLDTSAVRFCFPAAFRDVLHNWIAHTLTMPTAADVSARNQRSRTA